MRPDLRTSFVGRVVLGQIATLPLVIAGVAVLFFEAVIHQRQ